MPRKFRLGRHRERKKQITKHQKQTEDYYPPLCPLVVSLPLEAYMAARSSNIDCLGWRLQEIGGLPSGQQFFLLVNVDVWKNLAILLDSLLLFPYFRMDD